ncbi:hypothetical protein EYF88_06305 [Paracoccus sediminis]|nr:hypothetical protein [Paracoccus sediminis]TBN51407.1 hypothetical protein EYF88_06305 [Paracoccus sediminis]
MASSTFIDRVAIASLTISFSGAATWKQQDGEMATTAMVWIILALFCLIYAVFIPSYLRRSFGKVVLVMLPLLAIVIALLFTIFEATAIIPVRSRPVVVSATMLALGWLAAALVKILVAEEEKHQSRRDALMALQSEIFAYVDKLDNQAIEETALRTQGQIRAGVWDARVGRLPYYPFSTRESEPIAFDNASQTIPSLNEQTVAAVLRFYAEYADMRTLIDDCNTEFFRSLSAERRVAVHKEMTKRRIGTLRWGLKALAEINRELGRDPNRIVRSGLNPKILAED